MSEGYNTIRLSATDRGIRAAVYLLGEGQTVAFPTETVYGLGADARNTRAVAGIYRAKDRPSFNPLIVHVASLSVAETLVDISPQARLLAEAFWPGPLTLVLPLRPDAAIAEPVTAGLTTLAIRVPAHPLAVDLLQAYGGPLAAPSANPSGRISATTADHVMEGLSGRIGAVLDGGPCDVGLESTIVGFEGDRAVCLRPGGLDVARIAEVLGSPVGTGTGSKITAPGQLKSHYAPKLPVRLGVTDPEPGELWLSFGPAREFPGLNLSETGDLEEAAHNLFAYLHLLDEAGVETNAKGIAVAPIPAKGLGQAINDRLSRAAADRAGV